MASPYRQELVNQFGFEPPQDYLIYLLTVESTHQFGSAYLVQADELVQFNADHEAAEFYPGYFLIGGHDGEAFAIEKATGLLKLHSLATTKRLPLFWALRDMSFWSICKLRTLSSY
jgi:hypothetical protein